MINYPDETIVVSCTDMDSRPNRVETVCACGVHIGHDPAMEANIKRAYPERPIVFECLSCCAERADAGDIDPVETMKRSVGFLPEAVREEVGDGRPDTFPGFLKRFRRQ